MKPHANTEASRRTFIRTSGLAASTLILPSFDLGAMSSVLKDKKLKLALIGCGGRGTGAANQALEADPEVELIAMSDLFEDRLNSSFASLMEKYEGTGKMNVPDANKFVGFDGFKKAIDLADVVILTTPPGFRPYHFEYAIQQGKHVFMEKPLATDAPGIRKVLEVARLADEKGLNVVVGLQRRYQDNYLRTLEQLKAGAIGRIRSGQVYWNSDGVWVRPRQASETELQYQMRNWYYFNWVCGDHILEQHIHNIDVANWFIGSYPVSAQGMGGRQVRTGPDHGEIFDHHFVEFTYADGAVVSSQCRHQPGTMSRVGEQFQGTKGTVETNDAGVARILDLEGNITATIRNPEGHNPYQEEHNRLFASIRAGDQINNAVYGAYSTLTAIMGRMATYSGQVITWEDALNSNVRLMPATVDWDTLPPSLPDAQGKYPIPTPGITQAY